MTRVGTLFPSLLLAFGATGQDPEPAPSIATEIATLIERTNALESFRCVWLGHEGRQRLEFTYKAPSAGAVRWVDPEAGTVSKGTELRFDGERIAFRDEQGTWRSCGLPYTPALALLDELFPGTHALGPGIDFCLGGTTDLYCDARFHPQGRDALLAWLVTMQAEVETVVREGDALVWTIGTCELRVGCDSGFPRRITVRAPTRTLTLELAECTTDEDVTLLALPEDVEPASEEDTPRLLLGLWSLPSTVRSEAFERLDTLLGAGLEWDSRTRADWEAFLVALHGAEIEYRLNGWIKDLLGYINDSLRRARATLEQSDTPEVRATLATHFDELEQGLAPGFEQAPAIYLEHLEELEDPRAELLEVEREVVLRLHDERVRQPILAYLAEQRTELLGQ